MTTGSPRSMPHDGWPAPSPERRPTPRQPLPPRTEHALTLDESFENQCGTHFRPPTFFASRRKSAADNLFVEQPGAELLADPCQNPSINRRTAAAATLVDATSAR